jgi:hypothetical protein
VGFPEDDFDPLKRLREQQEAVNRALDPMKQFREQQEAINRALDPMKQLREQQEAITRALSPLRAVRLDQSGLLAHGGSISFVNAPLTAWREQQTALRTVVDPLARWRVGFSTPLAWPVHRGTAYRRFHLTQSLALPTHWTTSPYARSGSFRGIDRPDRRTRPGCARR